MITDLKRPVPSGIYCPALFLKFILCTSALLNDLVLLPDSCQSSFKIKGKELEVAFYSYGKQGLLSMHQLSLKETVKMYNRKT